MHKASTISTSTPYTAGDVVVIIIIIIIIIIIRTGNICANRSRANDGFSWKTTARR
jgi:hypothetical protein